MTRTFGSTNYLKKTRRIRNFWTGIYVQNSAGYLNMYTSPGTPERTKHFIKVNKALI